MERWGPARRADLATGASLSYVVVGDSGTMPVILLHAWGESRRSFDRLLAQLPTGICAVAVDQRGHGDAAEPSGGFSLKDFAGDVLSLMDALGIRRAVLLGSSSGGYVAQQVAVSHPTRVAAWSWSVHRASCRVGRLSPTRSRGSQIQWMSSGFAGR